MKNVQITEELFADLIKYFFGDCKDLEESIMLQLQQKADKMYARQQYTTKLKAGGNHTPA